MGNEENLSLETEQVAAIVKEIKEKTKRNAYRLTINKEKQPGILDSKFGGVPYWDESMEYPVNSEGAKMMMLAQINLDGLEKLNNADGIELPDCGIIQFFITPNDEFGIDFEKFDSQKNYKAVYHKTIHEDVTEEKVRALGIPVSSDKDMEDYSPVFVTCAIDISVEEVYLSLCDYRFEKMFKLEAQKLFHIDTEGVDLFDLLCEDDYEDCVEELNADGHWMLAYSYFTQEDPRSYTEELRIYDTMLFQMDSEMAGRMDYVLWGDCGVGNFFINSEALKKQDFGRTLYTWDCC